MRNPSLHAALRDFALEAASTLMAAVDGGDELGYDVVEEPGSGPILYRYRALTAEYIDAHWHEVRVLPSVGPAARELGAGATTWLSTHGLAGADAEPALRAMLERLYDDATSFEFPEERFERIYREVEGTLFEGTARVAAVAPLRGARLESGRVEIGAGVALVRGDAADAPREAVWPHPQLVAEGSESSVLVVIERESAGGAALPIAPVRARVADVVRALRLWAPGRLEPVGSGWVRSDAGPWQHFDVPAAGPGRGEPWTLLQEEEGELREFIEAIEHVRVPGRVAWALDRFELGCERERDADALSDFLMALRALLDANDEAGRASLSLRLAALCAEEPERRAVQRRTELAFALERFLMAGGGADAYVDEVGSESPTLLAGHVEGCVRALLRDILCGYLEPDLRRTADDILLTSGAPVEIEARDLRRDPDDEPVTEDLPALSELLHEEEGPVPAARGEAESPVAQGPTPEPASATEAAKPRPRAKAKPKSKARAKAKPQPKSKPRPKRAEPSQEELEPALADGVTPSADWGFDDADCYSAPV